MNVLIRFCFFLYTHCIFKTFIMILSTALLFSTRVSIVTLYVTQNKVLSQDHGLSLRVMGRKSRRFSVAAMDAGQGSAAAAAAGCRGRDLSSACVGPICLSASQSSKWPLPFKFSTEILNAFCHVTMRAVCPTNLHILDFVSTTMFD
jgi:hypothetical protein